MTEQTDTAPISATVTVLKTITLDEGLPPPAAADLVRFARSELMDEGRVLEYRNAWFDLAPRSGQVKYSAERLFTQAETLPEDDRRRLTWAVSNARILSGASGDELVLFADRPWRQRDSRPEHPAVLVHLLATKYNLGAYPQNN
jgi:hypothetical protein